MIYKRAIIRFIRITLISILILFLNFFVVKLPAWSLDSAFIIRTLVNSAPVLSNIEALPLVYTENAGPKTITGKITVRDADDVYLESAYVSISLNYQSGADLLLFTDINGIKGEWNSGTGILSLTGTSSVANYQAALRSVKYFNNSDDPSIFPRTISFVVNDGELSGLPLTRRIYITAVNDAPELSDIETTALIYNINGEPVPITNTLKVTDADDVNIERAVVKISVNYRNREDVLSFMNANGITGIWDSGKGILTLTGTSSADNYQTALRSVTYNNTSVNPSTVVRTVAFKVNDGSLDSKELSRKIELKKLNEAPVAGSVMFSGSMTIGSLLTGSYEYSDKEGDPEGISEYRWLRADDITGTNETGISDAVLKTYTLTQADIDKYISFEVKPVATGGTSPGEAAKSPGQHVISLPSDWNVNPADFAYNGLVTAIVFIVEGNEAASGFLAAFVGDECRGVADPVYDESSGQFMFDLTCYSNQLSGEILTFRYYDPAADLIYYLDRSVNFINDMNVGNHEKPFIMNVGVDYNILFPSGWSWFSVNSYLDNMTLDFILPPIFNEGDYIKDQANSATYFNEYGWFGSLTALDTISLYKIKIQDSTIVKFFGRPVDVGSTKIPVSSGWNWIGYLPHRSLPVNSALSSLELVDLDYIKNQTYSATYYKNFGWFGSLTAMHPTEGYILKLGNPGTLIYPGPDKKGNNNKSDIKELQFNPSDFEFNGSITAEIILNGIKSGSKDDRLFAYVNNEIRGVSGGLFFEPKNIWLFSLMIYSNIKEGEVVRFQFLNSAENKYYSCVDTIIFRNDMVVANAFKPLGLNFYSSLPDSDDFQGKELEMIIYPNPSAHIVNIEYTIPELTHVTLVVYDLYGKAINVLLDQKMKPDHYSIKWIPQTKRNGIYFIRLQAGYRHTVQKVLLLP